MNDPHVSVLPPTNDRIDADVEAMALLRACRPRRNGWRRWRKSAWHGGGGWRVREPRQGGRWATSTSGVFARQDQIVLCRHLHSRPILAPRTAGVDVIADVADRGLGRLSRAESAPTRVASGRTGVRGK